MQGLLLVDKPQNFTSFDVVAKLRGMSGERRIGHTGTLDPMATGVLPVLLGKATKLTDLIQCTDKAYHVQMRFGIQTDTLDIWGNELRREKTRFRLEDIRGVLPAFTGRVQQVPPMYSAVKQGGKRLYQLAREGKEIKRPSRQVHIYSISLLNFDQQAQDLTLEVLCSKGTYIRTLCDDMGKMLGSCAVLTALRRTMACGFPLERCVSLETLQDSGVEAALLPAAEAMRGYPRVQVSPAQARRFSNGGELAIDRLSMPELTAKYYLIFDREDFLGVARKEEQANTLRVQCLL